MSNLITGDVLNYQSEIQRRAGPDRAVRLTAGRTRVRVSVDGAAHSFVYSDGEVRRADTWNKAGRAIGNVYAMPKLLESIHERGHVRYIGSWAGCDS